MSDKYELGRSTRNEVLGGADVGDMAATSDPFNAPLQRWFSEAIWADIWGREELPRRERSLVTLAMLLALGRSEDFRVHLPAALRNGCTLVEIREVILHGAAYCGGPKSLAALKIANDVLAKEISAFAEETVAD